MQPRLQHAVFIRRQGISRDYSVGVGGCTEVQRDRNYILQVRGSVYRICCLSNNALIALGGQMLGHCNGIHHIYRIHCRLCLSLHNEGSSL